MQIIPYRDDHFDGVNALWKQCFPTDPPRNHALSAIPAKLALKDDLLLVAQDESGEVLGTVMAGYDGHRGWLYSVAVTPTRRRGKIGKLLVDEACERLKVVGCVKVNLQIRADNYDVQVFYETLGFCKEERISMGRVL